MTPPDRDATPPDRDEQPDDAAGSESEAGGGAARSGFTEEFEAALETDFGEGFGADVAAGLEASDEEEPEEPVEPEDPADPEEVEPPDEPEPVEASSEPEALEGPDEPAEIYEPDEIGEPDEIDEPDEPDEPAEIDEPAQAPAAEHAEEAGDADSVRARVAQETVEADVLALADAEEAAEQQAAAGVGAAVATEQAPSPGPRVGPPMAPEAIAEDEDDRPPKPRLWLRFLAASFVIVVSIATATAVTGLLYLTDIAKGLGGIKGVQEQLALVEGGSPQNILILGSDQRPGDPSARSDTTMLLRLDPNQDAISLFSLPRDLKVSIPGYGVDRLNAAYAYGGPKLTVETVKQLTGLQINHVVNVDFTGFLAAVNAIDCVYVDVDRRYYVPPDAGYAEINVEAGYQQMCGEKALQYVRFRHADSDITRTARQQDFLREARQKIGPGRLFRDRTELIKIFTRYTTSDIEDPQTMLEVLKLFLSVADAPVKEIHFQGDIGPSYITVSQEQMQTAVQQFLGQQDTPGPRGGGASGSDEGGAGGGGDDHKAPEPALIDSSEFGRHLAERFVRSTRFPVFYPTKLTPGAQFSADSRTYEIADEDGHAHPIYKFVISTPLLGEYYGISGTTWQDPPILDNPSESREIGDRTYDLYYDGDRLRMVAWHTDDGAYWLTNSLLQSIDEQQMLEIAETMEDAAPK